MQDFGEGPLDVLMNVAGVYEQWDDRGFADLSADDLMGHFRVNVVVRTSIHLSIHSFCLR